MTDTTNTAPAAPAPGAGAPPPPAAAPAAPATGAPPPAATPPAPAPTGDVVIKAPWSDAKGVYTIGEKPWFESIPEEPVRETMRAKNYSNPNEVAMAYHNLLKLQNGNPEVTSVPKADAPQAEWDAFYNKLGRPESPDKYELKPGEGVAVDQPTLEFGKKLFHKLGAPPAKAQEAVDEWNKFVGEQMAARVEADRVANEQALAALETKWGAELKANQAAGLRVIKSLKLDPALLEGVEKSVGLAPVVELLAAIGRRSDEGAGPLGGTSGDPTNPANMSQEAIKNAISTLQADAAYNDAKHPGHGQAVERMAQLFAAQK